ncbi:adenylosuccinate synthase [Mucisphaera calidilacus]|uniref:Adenylosuccinate synthetase n=1 Tax=Mucisphaera calidilacus TaxID=2527982 RepID=A0A518BW15_9BACT|nr:adenylosuccinate synthase [Mucisphaera calidilacus]QDU71157.1 Adenylosuccinate synthetase [Mucisphaera calidilacus]
MTIVSEDNAQTHEAGPGQALENCIVVGLQWGDEGKGKVVDMLAERYDAVVRYNGGANAGHSVVVGDKRYALHLIPSGILYADKLNVLGNGVVIDVDQLIKEIDGLIDQGIAVGTNLRISDRAHIVMPYHKAQDGLVERAIAKGSGEGAAIGTTGRGIGPCYADKATRSTAIRVCDLLNPDVLRQKLTQTLKIKNTVLRALAEHAGESFEDFDTEELFARAVKHGKRLAPHVSDTSELLNDAITSGKHLLFEGANATLLDIDHGTYPYVTSSNCSSPGAHTGTGVPGHRVSKVVGIVKAYQTRVGGGPMPTELHDAQGDRIREQGREYGTTTGRPRRCGWLDLVALRYTTRVSGATDIALMLLDVLSGLGDLKLCTAYEIDGETTGRFPADVTKLEAARPVFETLPGFDEDLTGCRAVEDLPEAAQAYVHRIEEVVGVPVSIISVGPARDQTIWREPA